MKPTLVVGPGHVGQRLVLEEALELPSLGVTAVLGANGAGKSTLLEAICALPQAGRVPVRVGDIDVTTMTPAQRARVVASLGPTDMKDSGLTAAERVWHGSVHGPPGDVDRLVRALGLSQIWSKRLHALSTGELRRVNLGRVLLSSSPPVVLLDEALSGLDAHTALSVCAYLQQRAQHQHIMMVVHDPRVAQRHADFVVGLVAGRLCFQGPTSTLDDNALARIFPLT
jgi:iron complex transport system ATP-binding protein